MSWWFISNLELSLVINPTYTVKFLLHLSGGGWIPCFLLQYNMNCQLLCLGVEVGNAVWKMSWQIPFLWGMRHWRNSREKKKKKKKPLPVNKNPLAMFYCLKSKESSLFPCTNWCWKWFTMSHWEPTIRSKYMEESKPLGEIQGQGFHILDIKQEFYH